MLISTCTTIIFKNPTGRVNSRAINSTLLLGIMTQKMNTFMKKACCRILILNEC